MENNKGKLYLVSTGIGDIDNITVRADKIIREADVVLAMPFIQQTFSSLLDGKRVYDAGHAFFTNQPYNTAKENDEENIRKIVRDAVSSGKNVAVLDFGDPTIFSPQSAYLKEFADLSPEVVPGISSFNAANAAIGQEITGDYNKPIILTEAMESNERLDQIAATGSTLVFFTMQMNLPETVNRLKKYYSVDTPAVIVSHAGVSASQTVLRATLETIVDAVEKLDIPWQHLLYVGDALRR